MLAKQTGGRSSLAEARQNLLEMAGTATKEGWRWRGVPTLLTFPVSCVRGLVTQVHPAGTLSLGTGEGGGGVYRWGFRPEQPGAARSSPGDFWGL